MLIIFDYSFSAFLLSVCDFSLEKCIIGKVIDATYMIIERTTVILFIGSLVTA